MHYSHLYVLFLHHFNVKRDYYECHEILEELWLDEGRYLFYQGLIQISVALYHFRWDNLKGAKYLFEGGITKLSQYPDNHYGINLRKLRAESEVYLGKLKRYDEEPFDFYNLDIEIIDPHLQEMVQSIDERSLMEDKRRTEND